MIATLHFCLKWLELYLYIVFHCMLLIAYIVDQWFDKEMIWLSFVLVPLLVAFYNVLKMSFPMTALEAFNVLSAASPSALSQGFVLNHCCPFCNMFGLSVTTWADCMWITKIKQVTLLCFISTLVWQNMMEVTGSAVWHVLTRFACNR